MYLDLRDVSEKSERFERTYVASALTSAKEDYLVKDDVSLVFDVRKTQEKYHLVGRLVTKLDLICCRCLEAYPRPVDSAFDLLYVPQVRNNGDGEVEVEATGQDLKLIKFTEFLEQGPSQADVEKVSWDYIQTKQFVFY